MGARKRDARLAKVERFCMNCKTPLRLYDEIEPTLEEAASFIDPESYACPKCRSETDSLYPDEIRSETRAFYRIGQRLRPCPGCAQCLRCLCGNSAACIGLYEAWTKHQKAEPACNDCCGHGCEDGHCDKVDDICDGSGVLPARAKKVRR